MILVSFCSLLESMQNNHKKQNKQISVIEKGLELDGDFWNKFLQLLNNTEGLSQLLDVSKDKVSTWHEKISQAMKEKNKISEEEPINKNNKLM